MINPTAFQVFGHDIRWYGIIIAIGLLLGILLAIYHAKREGQDPDSILDLALIVVPMAVIFARIYYVVFQWNQIYSSQPFWHVFAIWEGGLAIYGAVIGGLLGAWIYVKFVNKKIKLLSLLDILAPSVILGQAIGRWGNFVNQEAYGAAMTNPTWQWFPAAVYIANPQIPGEQPGWYMATFFYESMWNFIVFAFLYFYFKNNKSRKPGYVFVFYLLLYGIGRVVIEGLREDSLMLGSVRVSQWLSGLLVVAAACVLLAPFAKKTYAGIKVRHDEAMAAPLDESLRLSVELPEEEEEPETEEEPKSNEAPAEGVSAGDETPEKADEGKEPPAEEQDGTDKKEGD